MKANHSLRIIARAIAIVCAGAAASAAFAQNREGSDISSLQASRWYTRDAYATPDSVQNIGSAAPTRARWVAPPPPVAAAPAPAPAPAPYVEPYVEPPPAYDPGPVAGGGWPPSDSQEVGGGGGGSAGGCFLTTATVQAMGKADNGEELTMARMLRDTKMTDGKGRAATELYYLVGPTIVERKKDWKDFYAKCVQPLTVMVKAGHHDLAVKRYSLETAKLVDQYATRYEDKALVQAVYDYAFGKGSFGSSVLPYSVKYAKLKAALKAGIVIGEDKLDRQQAALGLPV